MFTSAKSKKLVSFKEYVAEMKDGQGAVYYAAGESVDRVMMLPQVEVALEKATIFSF